MTEIDTQEFFNQKNSWSKYKDLILSYYLKPYLPKVASLQKPIAIIDCFAGPGMFEDGEPGSPQIIIEHLDTFSSKSENIRGLFIEADPELHEKLKSNATSSKINVDVRLGNFQDHIEEIVDIANTHTTFLFVDPIKPTQLKFNDLNQVYSKLKVNQSIETLINFLSNGFLRGILGIRDKITKDGSIMPNHDLTICNDNIAGGSYWHDIILNDQLSHEMKANSIAEGYTKTLEDTHGFNYVLNYPIKEKYSHGYPKYHLIFGSRHPDAFELMNRGMVKARREFVRTEFKEDTLFDIEPKEEVVSKNDVIKIIVETSKIIGNTSWKYLRISATQNSPCKYTDSDYNSAIKDSIKKGLLLSNSKGNKIEENANIWPQT